MAERDLPARDARRIWRGVGRWHARTALRAALAIALAAVGVNLRTAKAFGLTIPASLLQRADQVIE